MAFPIIPIRNAITTSQAAPLAGSLQLGELATNLETGKLYMKGNSGIVELSGTQGALTTNDITQLATPGKIPQLTSSGLISTNQIQALTTSQVAFLTTTAIAGLVPQLGVDGKIPSALLPPSSVGALTYRGSWDGNTPAITATTVNGVPPSTGDYYVASDNFYDIAGLGNNIHQILAGDTIAWNGTKWDLIHGARNEVVSVNNQTPTNGNVSLSPGNIGAVSTTALTTLATANGVPQLDGSGKISAVQIPALTTNQLAVCTTQQLGILSIDPISSNSFFVSTAGAAKIIPGTSTVVGGIKSSASIEIAGDGTATVAGAGTY
jgi:hypothetical protein